MLGNSGRTPGLCAMNYLWTFQTVIFCFSSCGHLKLKIEWLISSFTPGVREPSSLQVCEWSHLLRNHTCRVDTPGEGGRRDLSSLRHPRGQRVRARAGDQEGMVPHRNTINPEQWPNQGQVCEDKLELQFMCMYESSKTRTEKAELQIQQAKQSPDLQWRPWDTAAEETPEKE